MKVTCEGCQQALEIADPTAEAGEEIVVEHSDRDGGCGAKTTIANPAAPKEEAR